MLKNDPLAQLLPWVQKMGSENIVAKRKIKLLNF